MKNTTRLLFTTYLAQMATINGIGTIAAGQKFNVTPSVQQKLEDRIQESSAFLQKVNIIGVDQQMGQKLGLGVTGPIARTNDTTVDKRQPRNLADLSELDEYICTQTNFDTAMPYALLDQWAKFPDFQTRVRDYLIRQQALDRIMIGFNGVARAPISNFAANPLLQDVNKGWLQKIREFAPEKVMDYSDRVRDQPNNPHDSKITIGVGGDYVNLDALVFDMVNNLIAPPFREDPNLVAVMSRGMLADKYFPLINREQRAEDVLATDLIISQKRVGGLPAVTVPYFLPGSLMVTTLDNLSIYFQNGSRRRLIRDEPEWDRTSDYQSSNECYVVENYQKSALAENIEIKAA